MKKIEEQRPILTRPVDDRYPVIQEYGVINPYTTKFYGEYQGRHPGVDFGMPERSYVVTAFPGIVYRTQDNHPGMGKVVAVVSNNIYGIYGHLNEIGVDLGQVVRTGELIGLSGNTGSATLEPHLHFELRDLTMRPLNEMIFEPIFGERIRQWMELVGCVTNLNWIHAVGGLGLRDVLGINIRR